MKTFLFIVFLGFISLNFAQAQGRNLKKFKPEKNMVALDFFKPQTDLKIKQKAYVQYPLHASVGIDGELLISDDKIIKIVQRHVAYDKAHIQGVTGDDSATVTLVLEVQKAGKAELSLKKIFRGQTELERKMAITAK